MRVNVLANNKYFHVLVYYFFCIEKKKRVTKITKKYHNNINIKTKCLFLKFFIYKLQFGFLTNGVVVKFFSLILF